MDGWIVYSKLLKFDFDHFITFFVLRNGVRAQSKLLALFAQLAMAAFVNWDEFKCWFEFKSILLILFCFMRYFGTLEKCHINYILCLSAAGGKYFNNGFECYFSC